MCLNNVFRLATVLNANLKKNQTIQLRITTNVNNITNIPNLMHKFIHYLTYLFLIRSFGITHICFLSALSCLSFIHILLQFFLWRISFLFPNHFAFMKNQISNIYLLPKTKMQSPSKQQPQQVTSFLSFEQNKKLQYGIKINPKWKKNISFRWPKSK